MESSAYPASSESTHIIFPRRKAGDGIYFSPPEPIVVTHELLASLNDHPLCSAAEKLGVSATAFKRACRCLGVRRWGYQKASDRVRAKAFRRQSNSVLDSSHPALLHASASAPCLGRVEQLSTDTEDSSAVSCIASTGEKPASASACCRRGGGWDDPQDFNDSPSLSTTDAESLGRGAAGNWGMEFDVELSPESEVLSGEAVFEWPRYL
jgi:hypothetical protein